MVLPATIAGSGGFLPAEGSPTRGHQYPHHAAGSHQVGSAHHSHHHHHHSHHRSHPGPGSSTDSLGLSPGSGALAFDSPDLPPVTGTSTSTFAEDLRPGADFSHAGDLGSLLGSEGGALPRASPGATDWLPSRIAGAADLTDTILAAGLPSGDKADLDFLSGLKLIRDAFNLRSSMRDQELARLRHELDRKTAELEDLNARHVRLGEEYRQATDRNARLHLEIRRLYSFRKHIIDSFDELEGQNAAAASKAAMASSEPAPGSVDSFASVHPPGGAAKGPTSGTPPRTSSWNSPGSRVSPPGPRPVSGPTAPGLSHLGVRDLGTHLSTEAPSGVQAPATAPSVGSAPGAGPSLGSPAVVDGREFFTLAKSVLPPEKFSALIDAIAKYNRRQYDQTQLETIMYNIARSMYYPPAPGTPGVSPVPAPASHDIEKLLSSFDALFLVK
ncbi:hypothetical protein H696_01079 [Fonticula alba]|uniref:Uncharacterized protein n=1 Tax=Fonticula alba TaxID=691883 RepID=A0A058ZCK5_FONAL|nr:hypothetical protein H696_01079 [Fonticula alba]KCV71663.1 hypothetical protein H696_01079 [Fonticula alba]|eukprot:XP_009493241.1 hypothetical protein H696_01079 [Fonticula alba]